MFYWLFTDMLCCWGWGQPGSTNLSLLARWLVRCTEIQLEPSFHTRQRKLYTRSHWTRAWTRGFSLFLGFVAFVQPRVLSKLSSSSQRWDTRIRESRRPQALDSSGTHRNLFFFLFPPPLLLLVRLCSLCSLFLLFQLQTFFFILYSSNGSPLP